MILPVFLELINPLAQVLDFPLEFLFPVSIGGQEFLHPEQGDLVQNHGGSQGGHRHLELLQFFSGLGQPVGCRCVLPGFSHVVRLFSNWAIPV